MSATSSAGTGPKPSPIKGFVVGAAATCSAVTFTNVFEVAKVRMQLQGELNARSAAGTGPPLRVYTSAPQALVSIARGEGIRGLQRGLVSAYIYQTVMNGIRLGFYDPLKHLLSATAHGVAGVPVDAAGNALTDRSVPTWLVRFDTTAVPLAAGFMTGAMGALASSPLFLVKTRMQSYSSDPRLAGVGTQHKYRSVFHALTVVTQEGGIKGLWRGASISMLRTGCGSSTQLFLYDRIKRSLLAPAGPGQAPRFTDGIPLHATASMMTGLLVASVMNPFDVVMTRNYNQPVRADGSGVLYKGPLDCAIKTWRGEGVRAFGKGWLAHYLRAGPHTILTFVFLEQYRKLQGTYWP
ncbi:mitochondrial carrier domain-containing protein [Blastocladiella britannica]|nr:mitochondrial carrier domain-containing protein [Blastocladiella britannica]